MFEANAKLPKTMGLVSTLLHFPRINFIHLHCSYQKRESYSMLLFTLEVLHAKRKCFEDCFFLMLKSLHDHYAVDLKTYRE